jgi:ferric-dicitrate binding protein FerR (iron transport regulator)
MAYENEDHIATTLVEGSVKITNMELEAPVYLIPGQQATTVGISNYIKVAKVDIYQYTSWKDGLFVFKSEPLSSIVRKFSRWYDCEIQFTDEELKETRFTGTLKKNTNLENLLNIISQTSQLDFTVNKNNVLIISNKK